MRSGLILSSHASVYFRQSLADEPEIPLFGNPAASCKVITILPAQGSPHQDLALIKGSKEMRTGPAGSKLAADRDVPHAAAMQGKRITTVPGAAMRSP